VLFPSRRALVQRDGRGPLTVAQLEAILAEVRRDGFASEDGSVTPGFASVAVAVLDHRGYPTAAVALTSPAEELSSAAARNTATVHVRRAASRIETGLMGRAEQT
jgi:DNA-binding IclR family transcriptional regulator